MLPNFLFQIPSILLSLLGISFIIVFHEFGHYIFCKLFNVYTPTFSIGIGKILYSKKIGDTNFCVSAGPIGGYVEVASESGINGSLGFNQIPYYQKVLMMLGGILFNFVLAYIIFVGLFFTGMPDSGSAPYEVNTNIIASVQEKSINAENLQAGDRIIQLNNESIKDDLSAARQIVTKEFSTKATFVSAIVQRAEDQIPLTLKLEGPATSPSISKQLGVSFVPKPSLPLKDSLIQACLATNFYLSAIARGLKDMVKNRNANGLVGPVMAVAASSKSAQKGLSSLLFLLAIISINLGFMNLLPLPIFDGGQFVIFSIEAATRKELSERIRNAIGIFSWALAIGLLVIFTIRDLYTLVF